MKSLVHFLLCLCLGYSLDVVVVPSVYEEWQEGMPSWMTDSSIQAKYNFSTFLYQKLDANQPNYISTNRGTEAGVYLRYIVDHYDHLPDIMVFIHAHPDDHSPNWLQLVGCVAPTASYININFVNMYASTIKWGIKSVEGEYWVEQCWRDTLSVTWNMSTSSAEFKALVPPGHPIVVSFVCCQQFILSREQVQKRSLETWKRLHQMIAVDPQCHQGDLDYESLGAYHRHHIKPGPEPVSIESLGDKKKKGFGRHTQGGAMEHLAHVVFGGHPLDMSFPGQKELCEHFRHGCEGSPCH